MKIIPHSKPDDPLFNRRLMAYIGILFSILWVSVILAIDVYMSFKLDMQRAEFRFGLDRIALYLGVPAGIAGLALWEYLGAAKKVDEK